MLKPSLDDLIKSSIRSILKNKGRTILTSLGIIIGVTSVILLISIGNGLKSYITDTFESLGSNFIYVAPGKVFNSSGGFNQNADTIQMTFDSKDMSKLQRGMRDTATAVIPLNASPVTVNYKDKKVDSTIVATTSQYATARNQKILEGKWYTPQDDEKGDNIIVLGHKVSMDLFGSTKGVNRTVIINGKNLRVIGVMDKIGATFGGPDFDNYIYAPMETGNSIIGLDSIQQFQIGVRDKDNIENAKKQAEKIMLSNYEEDEFSVFDQSQILSSINSILSMLTVGLTGIAAISLVVGGIGIMNIMLVTVTERTREIGLRKAIGAYPRAILIQFLIEAVILSGIGGLVGIILGSLGTAAISNFFPAKVTVDSIILAFGVSSAVGIIFGVAPARKASKLSPIEALRYE